MDERLAMSNDRKIIPLGDYTNRPTDEARPTKEVAEQRRIIRDLSARYRKLRKSKHVCPPPPNGGDAA
jgi:hypothetical protein